MQYFAGKDILAGNGYNGWASYFWPPLYSLLIGIGSLFVSGFFAGKLISILAGTILLCVVYLLAIELTNRQEVAILTQVFVGLTPIYFRESLTAHNHMLDAFLFGSGMWLFIRSSRNPTAEKIFIAGLICGLASLSRFTSNVLWALPFFLFTFKTKLKTNVKFAVAFWFGFALPCLPWWYYNTITRGSPFYAREELNICMQIVPVSWGWGSLIGLWQCNRQYNFESVFDILFAYPSAYLRNFFQNVVDFGVKLIKLSPNLIELAVIPGIFYSLFSIKSSYVIILFGEMILFMFLVSQAFVPDYALLPWVPLVILISITVIFASLKYVQERYPTVKKYHVESFLFGLLIIISVVVIVGTMKFNDQNSASALADLDQVTRALQQHDPNLATKVVMAVDPARAYYAGSKYLVTPLEYEGTIDGLVSYRGLSERVKIYAPKYPSNMSIGDTKADYLVYTRTPSNVSPWAPQDLPQFSFLLDPRSSQIPKNFDLVYYSDNVVVYEIRW